MNDTIEFRREKDTGEIVVYKNGDKIGEIVTMGDSILKEGDYNERYQIHKQQGRTAARH